MGQSLAQKAAHRLLQRRLTRYILAQDNIGLGFDHLVFIGCADHCAFQNTGMLGQHRLDLGRRHPDAADAQHIVHATYIKVIALRILVTLVTGEHATVPHGGSGFFRLVPVLLRGTGAFDKQIADFSDRQRRAVFVQANAFIALHNLPATAGHDGAGPVDHEHMGKFGRAHTIQNFFARNLQPFPVQSGRQQLAAADAYA